jgi:DNA-packaging protein gp3
MGYGRPRTYETPEELQTEVDAYFEYIKGEKQQNVLEGGLIQEVWLRQPEPATITGLALHIGFESRQSIYDYEKSGVFSYIIKNGRLRVECDYEKRLAGDKPTGAIFALKNMGWIDKTETDLNHSGQVSWNETRTYQKKADDTDPETD